MSSASRERSRPLTSRPSSGVIAMLPAIVVLATQAFITGAGAPTVASRLALAQPVCFPRAHQLQLPRARIVLDESSVPDRVSIKVVAPRNVLAKLAAQCRMEAGFKRGLTGVVYGLGVDRIEIIAEGKRVDKFVDWIKQYLEETCAEIDGPCELASIEAKDLVSSSGMYSTAFPLINFDMQVDRRVKIDMHGDKQVLDYTLRHTKIEAGFNRQLTYTPHWLDDHHLELTVDGPVPQLKSFVRWCRRGPPLQRPDKVLIDWIDPPLEEAVDMTTAFRDEGVGA